MLNKRRFISLNQNNLIVLYNFLRQFNIISVQMICKANLIYSVVYFIIVNKLSWDPRKVIPSLCEPQLPVLRNTNLDAILMQSDEFLINTQKCKAEMMEKSPFNVTFHVEQEWYRCRYAADTTDHPCVF